MVVGLPVGIVRILVGVEIFVGIGRGKFTRFSNSAIGSLARICINDVGAVTVQYLFAFERHVIRHAQRDRKSLGRTKHGISDSRIPACRIEQNLAVVELSTPAAFHHNVRGRAIFDGASRVVPFGLTQKCYAGHIGGKRGETQ